MTRLNRVTFKVCESNKTAADGDDPNLEGETCQTPGTYLNEGSTAANATGKDFVTAGAGTVSGTIKISAGADNEGLATAKRICVVETGPLDGYIVNDDNRTTCFKVSTANTR